MMNMILRWFPFGDDSVLLRHIRQVPCVSGVATCLSDQPVGAVWPLERLMALRDEVHAQGLKMEVIESVNIHEDIKKGLPTRDAYIDNYIATLENLAQVGVKCLCYNFMPVMDWARSDLAYPLADGSTVMRYRHEDVVRMNPASIADTLLGSSQGYSLPGWEPERLHAMGEDMRIYQEMDPDAYWSNAKYFLDAVVPVAERLDIRMAIHPDDPPWPLYGLPKVITSAENIRRYLALHDSPYNGLTLCTGSLGANIDNDVPALCYEFAKAGRVHFAHVRNVLHHSPQDFDETAHPSACGDLDMYAVMKALYDGGFDGYIRPDHGRMIWDEQARPGYGLYDRALGATYLLGLWEAIEKGASR